MFERTTTSSLENHAAAFWGPISRTGTAYSIPAEGGISYELYCASNVVLHDGRVLFAGGVHVPEGCADGHFNGHARAYVFDPKNPGFVQVGQMGSPTELGRWYPTATVLLNGKVVVNSGTDNCDKTFTQAIPSLFDPNGNTWTDLAATGIRSVQDWYPWVNTLTDGRILNSGPSRSSTQKMQTLVAASGTQWVDSGQNASALQGVNPAMYEAGSLATGRLAKILKPSSENIGIITDQVEIVSEVLLANGSRDTRSDFTTPACFKRVESYNSVLPDGTVLMTGGRSADGDVATVRVLQAELWNPVTTCWTRLADSPVDRMYHSTTLLLPDGRVLAAGGQGESNEMPYYNRSGDFFSPPYLFKNNSPIQDSERPVLSSVPALVATGSKFDVVLTLPSGTSIARANLVRPSAVTHSNNMDQRLIRLDESQIESQAGNHYLIPAPATAEEGPPGYYMLFILNNDASPPSVPVGRPSKAKIVRVWGILQTSIAISVSQVCGSGSSSLQFAVTWNTSIPSSGQNRLLVYSPASTCPTGGYFVAGTNTPSVPTTSHAITSQYFACQTGTWRFVVESTEGGTTSKSLCGSVVITCLSCCGCTVD